MMDQARIKALERALVGGGIVEVFPEKEKAFIDFWGGTWTKAEMTEALDRGITEPVLVYRKKLK